MTKNKKIRFAFIAGLAALTAALAFTAALRFAEDSSKDTIFDAPPSSEQTAEPPSHTTPSSVSEEAVQDAPKPTQETLDPDLNRWARLMRTQLELRGIQGEELERQLEQRRSELTNMDLSEREEHVINSGFRTVKWNPKYSDQTNRIRQKLFELTGSTRYPNEAPPELIEMLVGGLDDLTAAKNLRYPPPGWGWRSEREYARLYLERALAKNPDSRDGLLLKMRLTRLMDSKEDIPSARRLLELYPKDDEVLKEAAVALDYDYPEETIAFLESVAPKDGHHWSRQYLGTAYERLDMIDIANYHYLRIKPAHYNGPFYVSPDDRSVPSIWEERAAEAAQQLPLPAESPAPGFESPPDPQDMEPPHPHDHPDAPRGVEPPPPGAEMDMAAAYADFAKAYQDAFEMEYGLSEATPEGYMNALLGMARAFARAGDAQHAQDAYNAVRKRHSREEVEQVFRRFDEQERLKRQPSDEENDDSGEDE